MDATTIAAALTLVADHSRDAAILDLLQERERLAMIVEDQASYLAQRHWVGSLQVPRVPGPPVTWQAAYQQRHDDLGHAHGAMRAALQAHRRGDNEIVEQVLQTEVGSDSETEAEEMSEADATDGVSTAAGEEEEEEDMENDAEVES